ncbi:MAG: magnesium chelatase subunit D [Paracoccaceae bacterium]|nr:magnesium chelatase subunit D [Paracoccaceae bacterium]
MNSGSEIWVQVIAALHLLKTDPAGLKGAVFRVRTGPVRDSLAKEIRKLAGPVTRLHPNMSDEQLFGGIDVVATLQSGDLKATKGLFDRHGWFELTMAERCGLHTAARISQALDQRQICSLIVFDEGIDDEKLPDSLKERLAFYFDLSELAYSDTDFPEIETLSEKSQPFTTSQTDIQTLVLLANEFGISSARAPQLALAAAKANAMANGRQELSAEDLEIAVELVYPSRATQIPQKPTPEEPTPEQETQPEQNQDQETSDQDGNDDIELPNELLVDAIRALLPDNFLERLNAASPRITTSGVGFGLQTKSKTRGRPRPPRPDRINGQNRIDIVSTLRSAAPLQTIRKQNNCDARAVVIYPNDIHVKQYETRSERVVIFAVDASGSAALARLSEAKGAVELLLAQAYARRDFVALIAFRNVDAELLLPPTRSLVQTKRRLAELPGGGGTPMANGLRAAGELAIKSASQGKTPLIVVLTDGRANITLDGMPNRAVALEQSGNIGRWISSLGFKSVVLDMGNRSNPALAKVARDMNSLYFPLPRADALRISKTIEAELDR